MNADTKAVQRFDVYTAVTNTIIAAIENGAGTYQMPWHGSGAPIAKPQNALTRMEYHGVNVIALWVEAYGAGYESGYWATYRQWQEVGAQVSAGEHGSTIVFFKKLEAKEESEVPERLVARASRVFNANQVIGWTPPAPSIMAVGAELTACVRTFVAATKADVHYGGSRACYHIRDDFIELPAPDRFIGTATSSADETLAATLLHELIHWTGAKQRLDRGFGEICTKETLAREELVAELGAAFLCADLGVANEPRQDHAAYVASWLTVLQSDNRAIFRASRLANQAANYLHEMVAASEW